MWKVIEINTKKPGCLKFRIQQENSFMSNRQFLHLLKEDQKFISFYTGFLRDCQFEAFFWENKPVAHTNINKTYECSLVNSSILAGVVPNQQAFSSLFTGKKQVVSFPNLGGDAILIAPCPVAKPDVYTHIGKFVREAPEDQILEFWKKTAAMMMVNIGDEPKWLSTSGLGVYWLHARIDTYPKYYQTEDYKQV